MILVVIVLMVLAPVHVRPDVQHLHAHVATGVCQAFVDVVVPAHPDNRLLRLDMSDEGGPRGSSELPLGDRQASVRRTMTTLADSRTTITAWVLGERGRVRGSAVGVVHCLE